MDGSVKCGYMYAFLCSKFENLNIVLGVTKRKMKRHAIVPFILGIEQKNLITMNKYNWGYFISGCNRHLVVEKKYTKAKSNQMWTKILTSRKARRREEARRTMYATHKWKNKTAWDVRIKWIAREFIVVISH